MYVCIHVYIHIYIYTWIRRYLLWPYTTLSSRVRVSKSFFMDYLYPRIDKLISCNTCGSQSLPPYRLCLNGHVGCTPCAKYLALCSCGSRFAIGPHLAFDWVVMAMKLQCKYRQRTSGPGRTELRTSSGSGGPSDELFEGGKNNVFNIWLQSYIVGFNGSRRSR